MKKIIMTALFAALFSFLALRAEDNSNSQNFTSGRFAIVAAEVDVISGQSTQNNKQSVILKVDRKTGKVWILQLRVYGINNPVISNAAWFGVSDLKIKSSNNSN